MNFRVVPCGVRAAFCGPGLLNGVDPRWSAEFIPQEAASTRGDWLFQAVLQGNRPAE
jgi:hypothetical protein